MTNSSSMQQQLQQQRHNSNTERSETAAAEIHGTCIQVHTRTSYSGVQFSSIVIICQAQVLYCEGTHTMPNKKSLLKQGTVKKRKTLRTVNPRDCSLRECKLVSNHTFSYTAYLRLICMTTYEYTCGITCH